MSLIVSPASEEILDIAPSAHEIPKTGSAELASTSPIWKPMGFFIVQTGLE